MTRIPVPLTQFVVKMHSRCDLACDHCYVYEHADSSWRSRPKVIGDGILAKAAERIGEHAIAHRLSAVRVVLHGGEPLLAGPDRLRRAAEALRAALPPGCALDLRIHTNGVLLSEAFCELFAEVGVKVGISLDGDKAANDRHRRFADGRSSHPQVLRAVGLLNRPEYRHLFAGLLCTIDIENDPVAVYRALVELRPPAVDFLLPHATWEEPPKRLPGDAAQTPYADWLLTVHRLWETDRRPFAVRTFESVHRTVRGLSSLTESLGLEPSDLAVLETDGTFEQADSLKTAYDGAPVTGMNVFAHSIDDLARHPGIAARQSGLAGLSATCRACPVVRACGGGLYAHRYRADNAFDNPSVYCGDLMTLINGIAGSGGSAPGAARGAASAAASPSASASGSGPVPAQGGGSPLSAPVAAVAPTRLSSAQLDELARGYGGADTVAALSRAQLALTRAMLAAAWDASGQGRAEAWELLSELDVAAPAEVDAVLGHPYARAWAARRLAGDLSVGLGPLAALAAAAAVRAGRGDAVQVPARGGGLHLPTLGWVEVPDGEAVVTGRADGFEVRASDGSVRTALDRPLRRVRLAGGWTVALEDLDPLRDSHDHPVAGRLPEAELLAWTGALREAWELLGRDLPRYAEGLRAGLGTVTPLRPGPTGRDVSSAARQAYGAVAIARPATAPTLALLLAHEFQHVKLGAVLDLFDLYDRADDRLYFAPWRPDPRPLEGLLQGTYAHLAVTEYWGTRTAAYDGLAGEAADRARAQFALWRQYTAEAVERLAESGALTGLGARFVEGMGESVAPWLAVPLPAAAERDAGRARQERLATA
ncbi:FxsB family cyclophane-forming radical SAM/SPASM peptide maturase [Kitasatospora sp. NPDC096077]|uniref:FxsB family cyclophane-forming radical SAM/SPASM peptide maturase n=1 Tax=Kitasatospora sp. NPDC096077 TaxID=3155544 RepID=UPI00332178CD